MFNAVRLQASNPVALRSSSGGNGGIVSPPSRLSLRLPAPRRFASFTLLSVENATSEPSAASQLTSAVGSPPQLTLSHRHIQFLSLAACATAVSATWLFCAAIPALLAFKRAAESLEKLMDATREELPDTMAAVRLSGMEISNLTMELSDNGSDSELFCFRSRELVEVTKSSKDLRHSVLAVLEVEVDPSGGPKIQNAAMELYRRKEESAKINITRC